MIVKSSLMIVKCPNDFRIYPDKWHVFLAGPIQGAEDWQSELASKYNLSSVVWLSPRRDVPFVSDSKNYTEQIDWETAALNYADVILFWIPAQKEVIDSHSYAQTTRFELGENLAQGKKIIIGADKSIPGREYFEYKAKKYDNVIGGTVCETLDECIGLLTSYTMKNLRDMIPQKTYKKMYVLCNRRLAPMYAAVQGGHALSQWILEHPGQYSDDTMLVYLTCRLDKKLADMKDHGYDFSVFREPDLNNTVTAAACLGDKDLLFAKLKTLA